DSMKQTLQQTRKQLAFKLQKPRLMKITFHTTFFPRFFYSIYKVAVQKIYIVQCSRKWKRRFLMCLKVIPQKFFFKHMTFRYALIN
ncbi:hypothetical protein DRO59_08480, partial [Candidatus Bathyarchaeota archaeon]